MTNIRKFTATCAYAITMSTTILSGAEVFKTSKGDLSISHIGHGSVELQFNGKVIQVDPYGEVADYAKQDKPDLILITHDHYDHLDKKTLDKLNTEGVAIIASPSAAMQLTSQTIALRNGQSTERAGIIIEAVPAYNVLHKKNDGSPFHPKGYGNGYVLTFGDKKLYLAGDTEDIPEMEKLKGTIDIALMPKNLPYTMSDEMFVHAGKMVAPKVLYPYHYSEVNKTALTKQFEGTGIEFRVAPITGKK